MVRLRVFVAPWLVSCGLALIACSDSSGGGGGGGGGPGPDGSADGGQAVFGGVFHENFDWKGTHAAVVGGGKGSAVFWNADHWDLTGDTHAIAVMGEWFDTPQPNPAGGTTNTNSGHATYVHRAAKPCDPGTTAVCESGYDDTKLVPGGDGSPGVGVLHVDFQDIVGARLRNPVGVSEDKPAIVRVRAPRFVTGGHWWEIALTPADRVIGAENTVIESQGLQDGLGGVGDKPNAPGKGAGPGHDPQEESFNVVFTSATDFACENQTALEGSLTRIAIKSLVKGLDKAGGYKTATGVRYNDWNPKSIFGGTFHGNYQEDVIRPGFDGRKPLPASFLKADGSEDWAKVSPVNVADEYNLYFWQVEFRPSGVDVKADLNDGAGLTLVEHFKLGVPWNRVHVHLMAVAYQDDHHPQVQPNCAYLPNPYTKREMRFRTVSVEPVLYEKTTVFPPDGAPTDADGNVLLCRGSQSCGKWMAYDMRDTRNWGPPDTVTVSGAAQTLKKANPKVFSLTRNYAHGSTDHFGSGGTPKEASFDLYVPLTDDVRGAKAANFVYNVMGARGVATLFVNGTAVGRLPTADTVIGASIKNDIAVDPGCPDYDCMSVRRSLAIDPALLAKGAEGEVAHLRVVFDPAQLGSGTFLDRLQLELMR